jgi:hypothetical protein
MKDLTRLCMALGIAACSAGAFAMDAASTGASGPAAAPGVSAQTRKDAMSVKNDRMVKCNAMHGDEKKGCVETANADAKRVVDHAKAKSNTSSMQKQ